MGENPPENDRSDETLTPKEAYSLTEEQGMMGKTVAKMFDVSSGYVSQLKSQYQEGIDEGKESVSANDFGKETLENALADKKKDEDEYSCSNGDCSSTFDYGEYKECPGCGTPLNWGAL